jgi:transcriptional regulator with XRE-family HTH domain
VNYRKLKKCLGRRLLEAREAKDLTQRHAGELAGVSGTTLCLIENGVNCPQVETLVRVCEVLGVCPATTLLGAIEEAAERPERQKQRSA